MPSALVASWLPTVAVPAFTVLAAVTVLSPFRSFAKRTFNVSVPSDTTPMLSSAVNLVSSVMPPLTFT